MFWGVSEHKLDEKNRVFLPSRFKNEMGDSFIACRGFGGFECIWLFPSVQWQEMLEKIGSKSLVETERITNYLSEAYECSLDKQGRMVIPQRLREACGIEEDVVFSGKIKFVALWNPETYAKADSEAKNQVRGDVSALGI